MEQTEVGLDQTENLLVVVWVEPAVRREGQGEGFEGADPGREGVVGIGPKQTAGQLAGVEHAQVTQGEQHALSGQQRLEQACREG